MARMHRGAGGLEQHLHVRRVHHRRLVDEDPGPVGDRAARAPRRRRSRRCCTQRSAPIASPERWATMALVLTTMTRSAAGASRPCESRSASATVRSTVVFPVPARPMRLAQPVGSHIAADRLALLAATAAPARPTSRAAGRRHVGAADLRRGPGLDVAADRHLGLDEVGEGEEVELRIDPAVRTGMSSSTNRRSKVRSSSRVSPRPIAARAMLTRTVSRSTTESSRCRPFGVEEPVAQLARTRSAERCARSQRGPGSGSRAVMSMPVERRSSCQACPRAALVDLLRRPRPSAAGSCAAARRARRRSAAARSGPGTPSASRSARRWFVENRSAASRGMPATSQVIRPLRSVWYSSSMPRSSSRRANSADHDRVALRRLALDAQLVRRVGPVRVGVVRDRARRTRR